MKQISEIFYIKNSSCIVDNIEDDFEYYYSGYLNFIRYDCYDRFFILKYNAEINESIEESVRYNESRLNQIKNIIKNHKIDKRFLEKRILELNI